MADEQAAAIEEGKGGRIPVGIVTGFLGSGKTTLLNRLLADPALAGSIVIVNEFGEIGLDHLLIAKPREDVYLLSTGCLCCTIRGDLVTTLKMLVADRARGVVPWFDRILIETTGLAEPAPVLTTLIADEETSGLFTLSAVVATVDAVNGLGQIDAHGECVRQICVADHVVVTKCDLAAEADIVAVEQAIAALNPGAAILRGDEPGMPAALVAALDRGARQGAEAWLAAHAFEAPAAGAHADIRSFALTLEEPVTTAGLEVWMNLIGTFRGPDLLRIKAIVNLEGRPMVLHAAQHLFHPLEELPGWPSDDRRSRFVFITRDISREAVERTLPALRFAAPPKAETLIDPDSYAAFKALTQRFH